MVNCSHCGKELKRNVFCSASCKTMFHRKKTAIKNGSDADAEVERAIKEKEIKPTLKNEFHPVPKPKK